jgi:hypothetical protein
MHNPVLSERLDGARPNDDTSYRPKWANFPEEVMEYYARLEEEERRYQRPLWVQLSFLWIPVLIVVLALPVLVATCPLPLAIALWQITGEGILFVGWLLERRITAAVEWARLRVVLRMRLDGHGWSENHHG